MAQELTSQEMKEACLAKARQLRHEYEVFSRQPTTSEKTKNEWALMAAAVTNVINEIKAL